MDEAIIVKSIKQLSNYIDDAYIKSEDDRYSSFIANFTIFHGQIKSVYNKWFPKAKSCKDEDIVNQVFRNSIPSKDVKIYVKYSIACLLNSTQRVYKSILQAKESKKEEFFISEMELLKEMAFEAAIFMEYAFNVIEKKNIDFGHGKRFYIHPRETFEASRQILRKYVNNRSLGDFVLSPTSIFLIRQSIELWLLSIFAINSVTDGNNKLIKLQPEKLFKLLDNKGKTVETPISKVVIQKIHKWTQSYVHAGWMNYSWEIEHAQHLLLPIFSPKDIKIDKAHFDSIEEQLKKILNSPTLKLHRTKNHNGSKIKKQGDC
jgi:hypothetical protein